MLYEISDHGRTACSSIGIDPGPQSRPSLEHSFWVRKAAKYFETRKYEVTREHPVDGNGNIDLLAERSGERISVEIETGKSDIRENIQKLRGAGFDRIVLVATSPAAVGACQKAVDSVDRTTGAPIELLTWLDMS
jgi:hypothetical protein